MKKAGTVADRGRWLQERSPTAYDPSESYWLTGAWNDMLDLDPVDAVNYATELLKRAKVRAACK